MLSEPLSDWEQVLAAATHLQRILPGAVLVGGSASVVYAARWRDWRSVKAVSADCATLIFDHIVGLDD